MKAPDPKLTGHASYSMLLPNRMQAIGHAVTMSNEKRIHRCISFDSLKHPRYGFTITTKFNSPEITE